MGAGRSETLNCLSSASVGWPEMIRWVAIGCGWGLGGPLHSFGVQLLFDHVLICFASSFDADFVAADQHLGGAGQSVVVVRHGHSVGACGEDAQQVAARKR